MEVLMGEGTKRMSAFIDTDVFVAYFNERGFHHDRAFRLMQKISGGKYGEIYVLDYIFSKVVTVIALRTNLEKAIDVGDHRIISRLEGF